MVFLNHLDNLGWVTCIERYVQYCSSDPWATMKVADRTATNNRDKKDDQQHNSTT